MRAIAVRCSLVMILFFVIDATKLVIKSDIQFDATVTDIKFKCQAISGNEFNVTNETLYAKWIPNTNTAYTVIHKKMDLNGTTYSDYFTENYEVTLGTTVTPATLTSAQLPGFTAPATQTVTLNSFQNTVITYLYTRNQYDLIITNPQHVNASTSTPAGRYRTQKG